RPGGETDADGIGLSHFAGSQHQEGHPLPQSEDHLGTRGMERPAKETAKYYGPHGKGPDLNKAMDPASMGMDKWLESEKKIARLDAYGLASVAMDCRIGAISDTEKNVHCLLPKSIFVAKR